MKVVLSNGSTVGEIMEFTKFDLLAANLLNPSRGNLPNLYLYGPPGTSKTYFINQLIENIGESSTYLYSKPTYKISQHKQRPEHWKKLIGDRKAKFWWLTFHQGISYEDFVLGLRPIPEGGGLKLQPRAGPLLEAAEWAKKGGASFIIIDEMNRGDLPRILGDFITFMEYGNRLNEDGGGDDKLPLTFSNLNRDEDDPTQSEEIIFTNEKKEVKLKDGGYQIPHHLYILGTMNSLDRSVAPIDSAIERRFNRIPLDADPESLNNGGWPIDKAGAAVKELAINILKRVNNIIHENTTHYPEESYLGQAFLGTSKNAAALRYAATYRLLPQFKKVLGTKQDPFAKMLKDIDAYKTSIDIGDGRVLPEVEL